DDQVYAAGVVQTPPAPDVLRELAVRGGIAQDVSANTFMSSITLAGRSIGAVAVEGSANGAVLSESALHAITNLIAVGMDKARTQELASLAEAARQSEEFKSTLLDAVAHEFKTPLTSIKAATSTILTSKALSEEQQHELLTIIDQESERLSALVTEAIHLARVESGRLHLARTACNIGDLIEGALKQSSGLIGERPVETRIAS